MVKPQLDAIVANLMKAAQGRIREESGNAWNYGWSVESYRRSPDAAIATEFGRARLRPEAVHAFETAAEMTIALGASRNWDVDEVWADLAGLVGMLPNDQVDAERIIRIRLAEVLSPGSTLVTFPIANVDWKGPPQVIGDVVVGRAAPSFIEAVRSHAGGRPVLETGTSPDWRRSLTSSRGNRSAVTLFASWIQAAGQRAVKNAEESLENLLGAGILVGPGLEQLGLSAFRGDSHKPGVRGLTLHRPALRLAQLRKELVAEISHTGIYGSATSVHWYGESPFPLEKMLERPLDEQIGFIIPGHTSVTRRLRTAGRWLARATWARDVEDAALAGGIALEALLAEAGGSPGRVLTERFALLEPDRKIRPSRAKRMAELYQLRSAVAHGSRPSELDEPMTLSLMIDDVRWCASRLISLARDRDLHSEKDLTKLFDDLKWGLA